MIDQREIDHPKHYPEVRGVGPLDVIEALELPHHLACALKYLWRHGRKGDPDGDVQKAVFYLRRHLEVSQSHPTAWKCWRCNAGNEPAARFCYSCKVSKERNPANDG